MTCRVVLGAVVSLGFAVGVVFAQSSSSSVPNFAVAAESRLPIPSLSGSANQALTLGWDGEHFIEREPQYPSLLGSFYNANPSPPWKLSLSELSSGPEAMKVQPGLVVSAAPEPSTLALLGLGGMVMVQILRRGTTNRVRRK